ncbi:hypothetical protein [Peribacillus loiseleuriae]|uniref:Uncharacterized protein n=1 Tax=Peribacillus loiseleuriae TaxID=1679170 RepID=A0A0K9GV36_9BACI|nr:hypothetical protein [Peribacillus loiseleuriae]KMY50505.1 hypothetical protein AC625_14155 [Peribacillus loiseleuriae]
MVFDPTAFDNMKVIVEGAVYDRDLDGDILVTNRKDLVNLADLSREFIMEMELKHAHARKKIYAGITLISKLENLSAELLPQSDHKFATGSILTVMVAVQDKLDEIQTQHLMNVLTHIWGETRLIEKTESETKNNQEKQVLYTTECTISFGRLIKEEQIDDLVEIVDYVIETLEQLEPIFK